MRTVGLRNAGLKRGELARRTGCNLETVRYYEQIALLPPPPRTQAGHRIYGAEHERRLRFILRARQLGFTIEELRSLLALVDSDQLSCGEVHSVTVAHIGDIQRKIRDLRKLERILKDVSAKCTGDDAPDCPIIDALFEGSG
ncbi:MAG: Cu(I)-responsive transcriptional regulator [Parvularculaceae bacterium]